MWPNSSVQAWTKQDGREASWTDCQSWPRHLRRIGTRCRSRRRVTGIYHRTSALACVGAHADRPPGKVTAGHDAAMETHLPSSRRRLTLRGRPRRHTAPFGLIRLRPADPAPCARAAIDDQTLADVASKQTHEDTPWRLILHRLAQNGNPSVARIYHARRRSSPGSAPPREGGGLGRSGMN